MSEKRIHLRLNQHQAELLEEIRKQCHLNVKTDNDIIRFVIENYLKQIQQVEEMRSLIKTRLNFISKETSMALNSLLNLLAQQNIDITKANDQMIQYYQANKILNNDIVGRKNSNPITPQYTSEEIEVIKRQQREEKRKELAKKMGIITDEFSSNSSSNSLFDLQDQNPF